MTRPILRQVLAACLVLICSCSSQTNFDLFDVDASSLVASPPVIAADGQDSSRLLLQLMVSPGHPWAGVSAALTAEGNAVLVPAGHVTDATGALQASITTQAPGTIRLHAVLSAQGKSITLPLTADIEAVTPAYHGDIVLAHNTSLAGDSISAQFRVLDDQNAVAGAYAGSFVLSSSDPLATLPAAITLLAQDQGVKTFEFTPRTAGTQTLRISRAPAKDATSQAPEFLIAQVTVTLLINHAEPENLRFVSQPGTVHVGSNFASPPVVTSRDGYGNAIDDAGAIHMGIRSSDTNVMLTGSVDVSPIDGNAPFMIAINASTDGARLIATQGALSATSDAFDVVVTLGGRISGLPTNANASLGVGTDTLTLSTNGAFTFASYLHRGADYNVLILSAPGTCVLSGGNATVGAYDIHDVWLACEAYALGGDVAGLAGNNLVTLSDGSDVISVGNGNYTFPTAFAGRQPYVVTITDPPGQTCAITPVGSGAGTFASASVTDANVACTRNSYTLGGNVTGLGGGNVILTNLDNNDTLSAGVGGYTFVASIAYLENYNVTVTAPPGYTCSVANGVGAMPAANVSNANVTCTPINYSLGGIVAGLVTGNVTLTNVPLMDTIGAANGAFAFDQKVAFAHGYNVTLAQPVGQSCAITNGNGTMPAGNVSNVTVICTSLTYTLGGEVSGLVTGATLALHNGSETLTAGNGNFSFATPVAYGSTYGASLTQPTGHTCQFTANSNTGTMPAANNTNIQVACTTNAYALGGLISGLIGNTHVTLDDGNDTLLLTNGAYTFATLLAYDQNYTIAISSPAGQTCVFAPLGVGTGSMGAAPVTNANVTCTTNGYTLGGSVTGLAVGNVTVTNLDDNDTLSLGDGAYTFPVPIAYLGDYNVTVTAPSGYTCSIANGVGAMPAANVSNADVTCTAISYTLGGTVTGLVTGNVTLTNLPLTDTIGVPNGAFTFDQNVAFASDYNVALVQPVGQTCSITNGNGTMPAGNVSNVTIGCASQTYILGGQVNGLVTGATLALHNGSETLNAGNGNFAFVTPVAYGSTYAASLTQPTGHTCQFTANSNTGTMPAANDTNIQVACTANAYSLGGFISGLMNNTNVTLGDGNDTLLFTNGAYTFPTLLTYDQNYTVAITNPTGQSCSFTPVGVGSGSMGAAPVTNANVICTTNGYTLGGTITGITVGNVTVTNLDNNDTLSLGAGGYTLPSPIAYLDNYNVTVTPPSGYTCSISNGVGAMPAANVSNADVTCAPISYSLSGTVSGLVTGNVTLTNLPLADSIGAPNGTFAFDQNVAFASGYNVTLAQPVGQTCTIASGHGTMPAGNVSNVTVSCTSQTYILGGQVGGLVTGATLALHNGAETLNAGNGNFSFVTPVAYGSTYAASLTQPTGHTCQFTANSNTGTMPAADDTNIRVACTANSYSLGGLVSGLMSNTNVTLGDGNDVLLLTNGAYTFPTLLTYDQNYTIAISNPVGQTCAFAPSGVGSGTMGAASVSNANVVCATNAYPLGGAVSGLLTGNVTLTNIVNGDVIAVPNGSYSFDLNVPYTGNFNVMATSPNGQLCSVQNPNGAMPVGGNANVNVTCTPTNATYLTLTGYSSPRTAGQNSNITITAFDAYNHVAIGYQGTVHLTSSDLSAQLGSDVRFYLANAGMMSVPITLVTSGTQSVTGNDTITPGIAGIQSNIIVNPNVATQLTASGYTTPRTAGTNSNITLTVYDYYGNVATQYTGTVGLSVSGINALYPSTFTFVGGYAGTAQVPIVMTTAGTWSIVGNDTSTPSIAASQTNIVVNPAAAAALRLTLSSNAVIAGTAVDMTLQAVDAYGNPNVNYTGTVNFYSTDALAPFVNNTTTLNAANHAQVILPANIVMHTAGTRAIFARDTATYVTNANVAVSPNATTRTRWGPYFIMNANNAVSMTLSATDAYGNVTPSYTGTMSVTSTDPQGVPFTTVPTSVVFGAGDSGKKVFSTTHFPTVGLQTLTATDSGLGITGAHPVMSLAALAFPANSKAASYIFGANTFTQGSFGVTASSMNGEGDPYITTSGMMYVTDHDHHRVLGFNAIPSSNGASASFIFGQGGSTTASTPACTQGGLSGPWNASGDPNFGLLIADTGNHRILIYKTFPTTGAAVADTVIGSGDFATCNSACSPNRLFSPFAARYLPDYNVIMVADSSNNRLVIFPAAADMRGQAATLAIGQPDLVTCTSRNASPNSMTPRDFWTNGQQLFIGDNAHRRVLIYNSLPNLLNAGINNPDADAVLGQTDFAGSATGCTSQMFTSGGFNGITSDGNSLFFGDSSNSRMLIYDTLALTTNAAANRVVGAPDFVTCSAGSTQSTISAAKGMAIYGTQMVMIDYNNWRFLIFGG